jgi:ribosomal protein L21E
MGLANQAVTPGRTTLLEAVNVCLAVIGEAPINTLENEQVGEAAQAERTLLEYHKEGQTRGWGWNRERGVKFYPDPTTREVLIPPSVVKWAPSRLDWNNRFQARGGRVYDNEGRSYAIPAYVASIEADIVSLLPWNDCPEVFNRWATIRAARVFSNRAVGNTTTYQLTQAEEDQAWADLLRIDTEQSQPNAVTGDEAWVTFRPVMGLGRRRVFW